MNKNFTTILATAAFVLVTGCVTAGTWVNGYYIDGPICTVCDGMRVVQHAYGTTVCTHCDGTGIEPPEEEVTIVNNVVYDTWAPPPPRHCHRPCPIVHRNPSHHGGCGHGRAATGVRKTGGGGHGGGTHSKQKARVGAASRRTSHSSGRSAARSAGGGRHSGGRRR